MNKQLLIFTLMMMVSAWANAQITPDANNVLYVSKTAVGNNSGDSWINAVPELADALVYAKGQNNYTTENPLQIWVAGGTYKPMYSPGDNNFGTALYRSNSFLMVKNVQLFGGFAGGEATLAARDLSLIENTTTLSGDIGIVDDNSDNAYHVVVSSGDVGNAKLDGFSLIGGNAENNFNVVINGNNFFTKYGGGMLNVSSSPRLTNVIFSENKANRGGGMLNISSSSPSLTNVAFSKNTAANNGGGMYNEYSSPSLTNVTFSKNIANSYGGGMYNAYSTSVSLTNVTFNKNTASNYGGAMYNMVAYPSLINSIVWGNTATYGDNGIGNNGSLTTISYSLVQDIDNTSNNGLDGTDADNAPQFADADNDDLSLKDSSPVINLGSNAAYTTVGGDLVNDLDLAGNPRVFQFVIDMGAYESQAIQITPDANNIIYVNKTATGTGSGDSWTDAVPELADALVYAKEQNNFTTGNPLQIWVASGVYKPMYSPGDNNFGLYWGRNNSFLMVKNVQLFGGFAGDEATLAARDLSLTENASTLSGDLGNVDDNSDNAYHVIMSVGDVGNAKLDGFSLIGGNADGPYEITVNSNTLIFRHQGGGMVNQESSPSLANMIFRENTAIFNGGGMSNYLSSPSMVNVAFIKNTAGNQGGGMWNANYASPNMTNVTFSQNISGNLGGAMYNSYFSPPSLTNCIIWGNTATNGDNGIHSRTASDPIISHSLIQDINNTGNNGLDGTDPNNDPLFTDAPNGDLTLQDTSPAINAGNKWAYVAAGGNLQNDFDLAGNPRLFWSTIDMGGYESQVNLITPDANNILYVNKTATGTGYGNSWANALPELSDALVYAYYTSENPIQIWVAGGTYKPLYSPEDGINFGIDRGRDNSFLMVKNVQLYGGFAGGETTLAARDLSLTENTTTLNGDIGIVDDNSDNTYHVVVSAGDMGNAKLDGFSLTGGNAQNNSSNYIRINSKYIMVNAGGGMYNEEASPSLTNVTFTKNSASYGGGMFNSYSSSSLTNVIFSENTAIQGGGMSNSWSTLNLIDVTFSGNTAGYGGGMSNGFCSPSLTDVTFSGNSATNEGGGMYNFEASPSLTNLTFSENIATHTGGGMYNDSNSSPSLTNLTFSENTAEEGGGMSNKSSSPSLNYVTFSENTADWGGGMYNESSSPSLINVIFSQNTADLVGGMYNESSSPNLTNVTFSKNTADWGGGMVNDYASTPSLTNCIVWGNIGTSGGNGIYNDMGTIPIITYSLVQEFNDAGNNNIDGTNTNNDPQFTDADNGDLSLQANSPIINLGSNTAYTNAGGDLQVDVDLAGNPRLFGSTIDLGAYEYQGLPNGNYVYENDAWTPMDPQGNAVSTDNIFVRNGTTSITQALEINNISVMEGATLNLEDVLTINGNINNNGDLVFKSTATKNGELAEVSGTSTITGDITVERYMKARRSYRMVSSAVTTTTSVHDNWQEGATSNSDNPNPGFGTHITGSTTDQLNGFDGTITGNSSMFTVNVAAQQFEDMANTDVNTLTAGEAYLLFVRGNRSIDLTNPTDNLSSETVLRATGSLVTGTNTQNYATSNEGDIVMFGNPYQSTVDVSAVLVNSSNINTAHYYVYDPALGEYGAYVTVGLPSGTNTSGSAANQYLQPGQGAQAATIAAGVSSVVFSETDKAPGNFTSTNRPLLENNMLTVQLYTTENFNNGGSVHDSFGIIFAEGNNNSLTPADAVKPMNFYENLGIDHSGTYLSIEQRDMPQPAEVYPLYSIGYTKSEYTLKLTIDGLENSFLYLDDNFSGTTTLLDSGDTTYGFTVDANNPLSIATDRFSIRTEQRLGVDDNSLLSGIRLYPNPLNADTFYINAPRLNGEQLLVSISDLTGRSIYNQTLECRANTVTVPMGDNIASGVYLVTLTYGGEASTYRLIKE